MLNDMTDVTQTNFRTLLCLFSCDRIVCST